MQHSKDKITGVMALYNCSEDEAVRLLDLYDMGYRKGLKEGQAEAQRFFRIALGCEKPSRREAALWNNPVPLKKEGE